MIFDVYWYFVKIFDLLPYFIFPAHQHRRPHCLLLQALQDSKNYGQLLDFENYQKKLLSAQLAALEELMGEAQAVL
jgi:hypothetical protein